MRLRTIALLTAGLVHAGCDRPFVPIDPPAIEVVSPDFSEVQSLESVPVVLRVTSVRGVADVTVAGQPATRAAGTDLFLDTLSLAPGLNAFPLEARGADGNVAQDTLYALRLALETGVTPTGDLPEPRGHHAAISAPDGSVVISGGIGSDGAVRGDVYSLRETSPFTFDVASTGFLVAPRASHTAHLLSDGRMLVVGGSSRANPATADDFVAGVEIVDLSTGLSTLVPSLGDPVRRSGHVSFMLQSAGRTYVYVAGGRGPLGDGVGTPTSVIIAELRGSPGADTLVTLTPAGGAGVLEPVTAPAGVLLPPVDGNPRAIIAGLYEPEALAVSTRLAFLPGNGLYPFQVLEQQVPGPQGPRDDAAATLLDPADELVVLAGGRDAAGVVSAMLSVYAVRANRYFHVPLEGAALRVTRFGHTATLLPSGRIALVGGFTVPGNPTASTEVIFLE
jgi:hypothetical protein